MTDDSKTKSSSRPRPDEEIASPRAGGAGKKPYTAPGIADEEVFERRALEEGGKPSPFACPGGPFNPS